METKSKEKMTHQKKDLNENIFKIRIFLARNCKIGTTKKRALNKAEIIFISYAIHKAIETEALERDEFETASIIKTRLALPDPDLNEKLALQISGEDLLIRNAKTKKSDLFVSPLKITGKTHDFMSVFFQRHLLDSLKQHIQE